MSRPKHRTNPAGTYFVTTNTWERRKLFRKAPFSEILGTKIFEYRDRGAYQVHRYVIMPDHLHLILTPGPMTTLEKALALIKGGSSFDIGKSVATKFSVWQPGFSEHEIRDQSDYDIHVQYVDYNPVKAGLVADPQTYALSSLNGVYQLDKWPVASGANALL